MLGALAHGRDMSVLMLCWCQLHGKPGTGLTSLGEIRCPVVSSKCAPGSAPCGGWLCCWYQVPLISVMSGMYCAGDFSFSLSQAQECQEQRPHILLPCLMQAALQGWLPAGAGLEHLWGYWSIIPAEQGYGVPLLQGDLGPGTGSWLQGATVCCGGCLGESLVQGWSTGMWSYQRHCFLCQ